VDQSREAELAARGSPVHHKEQHVRRPDAALISTILEI
jgi:hypothetical protein